MLKPFRKNHIINILREFQQKQAPIDFFLHKYFKANHSIGSNDRKEIAEFVYQYIRWQGLVHHFVQGDLVNKIEWLSQHNPKDFLTQESIPLHIRLSFPKVYFEILRHSLSEKELIEFCLVSNEKAPITIRCNPLKITRDELLNRLKDRFEVTPTSLSPFGIQIHGKANLFQTPEFEQGLFEMQDEASQLVGFMVKASPKDAVLDYCCGAGGKTLSFAHQLQGHGQIYVHDVREQALLEAKKRFNRAGIQNFQILTKGSTTWKQKKHKMDWILVDAPCSGSGTLRRNPDQKWKFTIDMLNELVTLQRSIFEEALNFLKPSGKIVYATCSILKEENQSQIDHFCKEFKLKLTSDPFTSIPKSGEMDGFFAATLEKL
jgi:16S rRNA C967 or C1407 C5-methylase (RsmB/RsmF family)